MRRANNKFFLKKKINNNVIGPSPSSVGALTYNK